MYIATMFPGLVGIGDSPKFQFVGRVLGTPHAPGYPFYVSLSWLFSYVPVGTIAYRINLMSGVFGAVSVGLLAILLQRLGAGRLASFAIALAFGFGRVFWSQSIVAEVYTLNTALFLGMLIGLEQWERKRRDRDLLLATVCYALGLAHHPTMWLTGPAVVLFVLLVDRGVLTRPALLLRIAAIVAAGLSFYALIWMRTTQDAIFLEARARDIADIFSLLRGKQFEDQLYKFTWSEIWRERVPLISSWVGAELGVAAVLCAVVGAAILARARWRLAAALGVTLVTIASFTLQHDAYDIEVFLILPMLILWVAAGVGLGRLLTVGARRFRIDPRWSSAAAVALALAIPMERALTNFEVNNQRDHRFEMDFFDELFRRLPNKTAIVDEEYVINSMVAYKILAERAGNGPNMLMIAPEEEAVRLYFEGGFTVIAFRRGSARLQELGIPTEVMDLQLPFPRHGRHVLDATYDGILTLPRRVRSIDPA
jgi:hypothetical protein